jgi:hypothetical protein
MTLYDEAQAKAAVNEYLESKGWWVLMDPEGTGHIETIEAKYYSGEKNADFHMLLMPNVVPGFPLFAMAFANKTLCPAKDLAATLVESGLPSTEGEVEAMLETQDVLFIADKGGALNPQTVMDIALALDHWRLS